MGVQITVKQNAPAPSGNTGVWLIQRVTVLVIPRIGDHIEVFGHGGYLAGRVENVRHTIGEEHVITVLLEHPCT